MNVVSFFCRAELAKLRAAGLSSYLSSPAGSLASPGAGVTGDKDKDEASRKRRASFENDDEMDDEPILHPRQVLPECCFSTKTSVQRFFHGSSSKQVR